MRSYIIIFVLIGTRTYLSRNSFRQQFSVIYAQTVAIARNNATKRRFYEHPVSTADCTKASYRRRSEKTSALRIIYFRKPLSLDRAKQRLPRVWIRQIQCGIFMYGLKSHRSDCTQSDRKRTENEMFQRMRLK